MSPSTPSTAALGEISWGGSWHSSAGTVLKQNYLYPQLGKHNAVSLASISFLNPQI